MNNPSTSGQSSRPTRRNLDLTGQSPPKGFPEATVEKRIKKQQQLQQKFEEDRQREIESFRKFSSSYKQQKEDIAQISSQREDLKLKRLKRDLNRSRIFSNPESKLDISSTSTEEESFSSAFNDSQNHRHHHSQQR